MKSKRLCQQLMVVVTLATALHSETTSRWADTVVYPIGAYPADVQAVQAAVDGGGRVLLKATNANGQPKAFEFGPPRVDSGWVSITTGVQIRGETSGQSRTTIRGGYFPFQSKVPVRSAVTGIRFERPCGGAIFLGASSGARISDNVIIHVVGFPWDHGERKGTGVWIGGGCCSVTGTITIAHNTIADIDAEDGTGLAMVAFEATIKVLHNDIRGMNFMGILAFNQAGSVWVEDNVVIPGSERFHGAFYTSGNGIQIGPPNDFFHLPTGPARILRNRVICENPNADGIVVQGYGNGLYHSVVTNNQVKMLHNTIYGGITLADNVSHTLIGYNRVNGRAAYALDVLGLTDPIVPNRDNVFIGNDTTHFDAAVADVFLDQSTQDNWVLGCQGTVLDQGTDNHILGCYSPLGAGPASRFHESSSGKDNLLHAAF